MKCWTNILDLGITKKKKNGIHFVNLLFNFFEVGTPFEGGVDQRFSTACLLGRTTNSYITLATAPFLNRVHLENTEASVLAREVCSFAFNTFTPPYY